MITFWRRGKGTYMPNLYCNRTPGPLDKHAFAQVGGSKGHWGRCKVGQNVYFVLYPDTGAPEKCAFAQAEGSRGRWGRCNGALKGPLGALNMWFALTKNSRLSSNRQSKVCWPVICSTRRQLGVDGCSKASCDGQKFPSEPLRCSVAFQRLSNEFQRVLH